MYKENISFKYNNTIDSDGLEVLLNKIKLFLNENVDNITTKRRIYTSLIEVLENIINHNDEKLLNNHPVNVKIYNKNNNVIVEVSNIVHDKSVNTINEKFDLIKGKTKDEVKNIFHKQIKTVLRNKKNAGLGIFQVAKATDNNIVYSFSKIDDEHHKYTLIMTF